MLNVRFINPQILTVLPFYLQAVFQEVQTIPGLQLFLPPPSEVVDIPESSDSDSNISVDSSSSTLVGSASSTSLLTQPRRLSEGSQVSKFSHATVEPESLIRARMHLSRTVEVVRGCKEAMWDEYEKLHKMDRNVPNSRLDRDDFESYFHNWEWCVPNYFD